MSILITDLDTISGWIMKLAPAIAIVHTVYGVYHLARRSGHRAPGSSASYMVFASLIDITIVPFYAYISLAAKTKQTTWTTSLSDKTLLTIFTDILFYAATVGGGLHLISLAISIYLAVTFRKITKLPPDMNPLEDNLTSHHKRNKSSISTSTTITSPSEKRLSRGSNLEDKRRSGAPYEDLDRPPTIPFLHTRTNSNESFQTNQSSPRTSRTGSPARYNAYKPNQSSRHSVPDSKTASSVSSPKRASHYSYTSVPASDISFHTAKEFTDKAGEGGINWFTNDSLGKKEIAAADQTLVLPSPKKSSTSIKSSYHALPLDPSAIEDFEDNFHLPNPLMENPPTPRHNFPSSSSKYSSQAPSTITPDTNENYETHSDADIADESSWSLPLRSPEIRELTPKPLRTRDSGSSDSFNSKYYGDLKPATPPVMVGGDGIGRQVSSGTDFVGQGGSYRRDVSGKIAEEGRGGGAWGARLRNISGLQNL